MVSRKKTLLFILCLILALFALFYFFFLSKKVDTTSDISSEQGDCLLFQSTDAQKPCFIATDVKLTTSETTTSDIYRATSSTSNTYSTSPSQISPNPGFSVSDRLVVSSCASADQSKSDACVKKAAVDNKRSSICSGIGSFLERSDCISSVGRQDKPVQETFSQPTVNQTALTASPSTVAGPGETISSIFSDTLAAISRVVDSARANPDSRYTAEGFFQRFTQHNGLTLYAFSEYQVAPGTTITAQGVGFSKTGNTVHVGGSSISGLESADGTIITFIVPSMSDGTYEGWVENEKGSSRKENQKIYLVVTGSPAPRPAISSVSPKTPTAEDTLTFYGDNFGSSVNIVSTLGMKQNVPANGGSFSLKISDLPYFEKVRNAKNVNGMKVSFFVHIQNENGVTRQPFTFDVQF